MSPTRPILRYHGGKWLLAPWIISHFPQHIEPLTERLRGVVIENKDACAVMLQHDSPVTLHYADPPYVFDTRSMANPYCKKGYRHEMTDDQHRQLAVTLMELRGMVVLSGYACPLYDSDLYADWHRVERPALADGARPRTEVLWINDVAWRALDRTHEQQRLALA